MHYTAYSRERRSPIRRGYDDAPKKVDNPAEVRAMDAFHTTPDFNARDAGGAFDTYGVDLLIKLPKDQKEWQAQIKNGKSGINGFFFEGRAVELWFGKRPKTVPETVRLMASDHKMILNCQDWGDVEINREKIIAQSLAWKELANARTIEEEMGCVKALLDQLYEVADKAELRMDLNLELGTI